jgi:uncharacterized protein
MAIVRGAATPEGTKKNFKRGEELGLSSQAYRALGRTNWTVSGVGFGCYRIDDETPHHAESLGHALSRGCNLIDTSTNYTDGGSESCVGKVLSNLPSGISREEIIVVSKVGYVQGQNLELAHSREQSGTPYPEMVKYNEDCWHCIHPEFIKEQLSLSLQRTGLEKIDVYLLHNPEYFFSDALHQKGSANIPELRNEFYRRIEAAFACLEDEVKAGRIQCYGVSSNTFGKGEESGEMTSVEQMVKIAEKISSAHHFSVIQLPMNLFESGPFLERNNGELCALEVAERKGLGVLVNRPLNAFSHHRLIRLADFHEPKPEKPYSEFLPELRRLEGEFQEKIASRIQTATESASPKEFFRWGEALSTPDLERLSVEQWADFEHQVIRPQVYYLFQQLGKYFQNTDLQEWQAWAKQYAATLEKTLQGIRYQSSAKSQKSSDDISKRLDPFLPETWRNQTLSRKALGTLMHTPGVSCVLNGMREPRYVDDSLGALKLPAAKVERKLYEVFLEGNC